MALKQDGIVRPGALTRKEAANLLGMNDTEFALRLIWDSRFPEPVQGVFRAAHGSARTIFLPGSSVN